MTEMTKEVDTLDEAMAIVEPMRLEDKWAITVSNTPAGKFLVRWMEQKKYTAQDGIEYRDEVWITSDGKMKLVQDLEPEHAKNIIRMMLRQERESKAAMETLYQQISEHLTGMSEEYEENDETEQIPTGQILH